MKHSQQVRLIDACLLHIDQNTTQKAEQEHLSPCYKYHRQDWFEREMDVVFRKQPALVAHISELPEDNSFITYDLFGIPIIITRLKPGEYKALINVCRHRGVQVEPQASGCKNRFVCPYHGWTFGADGKLRGVPFAEGFPNLNKEDNGLVELQLWEKEGFIFVLADRDTTFDFDAFWAPLAEDFSGYNIPQLEVYRPVTKQWQTNWKIVAGGGLETYHFKVTHGKTIAPYFFNNVSICDPLTPHFRVTMPRQSIKTLVDKDKSEWNIRDHCHVVYQLFPNTAFILEEDHLAMFTMKPISPERTEITFRMLIPKQGMTDKSEAYWKKNHQITSDTLDEDFGIGELIQKGIKSGANEHLRFGLYEGGLTQLEKLIDNLIEQQDKSKNNMA